MAIDTRNSDPSIVELVRSAAADTTELVKQQIELTKAEIQQNVKTAGSSFGILAAGGAILGIGAIFLLVTIAYVIAVWLPVWAGFGIVTLVLLIVGAILVMVGRKRAKTINGPERSVAALEATKATFRG
jgi:uncharacterized membrane protein YjfL (UPF0719 family)